MIAYDPSLPLIGLHVPKCAGQSMQQVLRRWFGSRMHWHYFNERANRMPLRLHPGPIRRLISSLLRRGFCIYGHFNRARGFRVEDYYPDARQLFTMVRDPLSTALSLYFFAKCQGRDRYRGGQVAPIADRYQTVDAFIADQLERPYLVNYLPGPLTLENYVEMIQTRYVYIGIAEDLQTSIDHLAIRLGMAGIKAPHVNTSRHEETLDPGLAAAFERSRPLEYAIYHYALEHYRDDRSV